MTAAATLRDEHNAVGYVLDRMEEAAAAAARGAAIPVDLFADIQEFVETFIDRCHHSKEELEVFPRLRQTASGAVLVGKLEQDHATGRGLAAGYASAVADYRAGKPDAGAQLQAKAAAYAEALRRHIDLENAELLPAIDRELVAEDAGLVDAFERIEVERLGIGTHERLHGMIETLQPRIADAVA